MLKQLLDTSITISLSRLCYKRYSLIEDRLIEIYQASQTHRIILDCWGKMKSTCKYSFLGRISETGNAYPEVLDNNQTVQLLIKLYKNLRERIAHSLKLSLTFGLTEDTKQQLNFSLVRILGMIIVIATIVNVILSFILQKQIGVWGWLMRGLFLFAGVGGLFSPVDWPTLKESSIFLRRL